MSNFNNFERPVSEYDNSRISVAIFAIFHRNSQQIRAVRPIPAHARVPMALPPYFDVARLDAIGFGARKMTPGLESTTSHVGQTRAAMKIRPVGALGGLAEPRNLRKSL